MRLKKSDVTLIKRLSELYGTDKSGTIAEKIKKMTDGESRRDKHASLRKKTLFS